MNTIDLTTRNGIKKIKNFPSRMFNGLLMESIFPLLQTHLLFTQLYADKNNADLLERVASYCFRQIQVSLAKDLIITIGTLMDKKEKTKSLERLVLEIKKDLSDKVDHHNMKWLNDRMHYLRHISSDVIKMRNIGVAHKSLDEELPYVFRYDIDESVKTILETFLFISKYFKGELMKYEQIEETVHKTGGNKLIDCLKEYERMIQSS